MIDELNVYPFSIENYCVDISGKLSEEYGNLDSSELIEVTEFLVQNAGDKFSWKNLPVILSDGRKMTLSEVKKSGLNELGVTNIVVPENYDQQAGWQHIWRTEDDRKHFAALADCYPNDLVDALIEKIKIVKYPEFSKVTYQQEHDCIHSAEIELFKICSSKAAEAHSWNIKIESFRIPSGLINGLNTEAILSLIKHIDSLPSRYQYSSNSKLSELKSITGVYQKHGEKEAYQASPILSALRESTWFPTTKGSLPPVKAFLPKESIKEILGDTVPYFEGDLSEGITGFLGICTELTADTLLRVLADYSGDSSAKLEMTRKIYAELAPRSECYGTTISKIFSSKVLIFIPSDKTSGTWHKTENCIWTDSSDVLGDNFVYLEKYYPKLKDFFVETVRVKEKVDEKSFSGLWLKLQENPIDDKKEQTRVVEQLYRALKPIALTYEGFQPDWWDTFLRNAKVYTQSGTFEDPCEVVVPDDGELKNIFKDSDIHFAWRPPKDAFNSWMPFYEAFGIKTLSSSVEMELTGTVVADIDNTKNQYVTDDSIKMIAAWLREKREETYRQFLNKGIFESLLGIKEVPSEEAIEVHMTLNFEEITRSDYKVFWEREWHNMLILRDSAKKDDIASHLALKILGGRDYKDLSDWIELVLGASNTKRLNKKGWNVPQEIIDLCKTKPSIPKEKTVVTDESPKQPSDHGEDENQSETDSTKISPSPNLAKDHNSTKDCAQQKDEPAPSPHKEIEQKQDLSTEVIQRDSVVHDLSKPERKPTDFNYRNEFEKAFNRPGKTEVDEQVIDTGKVRNPALRRERSAAEHHERLQNEPSPKERRKTTSRTIFEVPNEEVREYLIHWYQGECQVCHQTFPEGNGNPFFIANYIVPRKFARSVDTQSNAMCLCADHFAKWQHGAIETDNVWEQIESFKTESEGGESEPILMVKLCGEECEIQFKEKHLFDLRELCRTSESQK